MKKTTKMSWGPHTLYQAVCEEYNQGWNEEVYSEKNMVNNSIKPCIDSVRSFTLGGVISINRQLIKNLLTIEGVRYYEVVRKDQVVFSLPLTLVNTQIKYPRLPIPSRIYLTLQIPLLTPLEDDFLRVHHILQGLQVLSGLEGPQQKQQVHLQRIKRGTAVLKVNLEFVLDYSLRAV